MITNIIATDDSLNMLIPKAFLKKSGLGAQAVVETRKGEIRIISARNKMADENSALSEKVLAADWNRPEEDKAWMNLK